MTMKVCGVVLFVALLGGISNASQRLKDAKGENGLVINDTRTKINEFLIENRLKKRSIWSDVEINRADMSLYMQGRTLHYAREALNRYTGKVDIADHIKDELDNYGGGKYNCIVGTSYGYSITYDERYYFYFTLNNYNILVFRR